MSTPPAQEPPRNYITPSGLQRLRDELRFLLTRERPAVTAVVAWAASNGDRSENADYQYGKRRLRQVDGRIHFLTKRIDAAIPVDPEAPRSARAAAQVFFGATVRYANRRSGQLTSTYKHVNNTAGTVFHLTAYLPITTIPRRTSGIQTRRRPWAGASERWTSHRRHGDAFCMVLRAYDRRTGKDAGSVLMDAPQTGSPMTYRWKGKQYIVVTISGPNTPGQYVAFALPDTTPRRAPTGGQQ